MKMAAKVGALGIADQTIRLQNRKLVTTWTDYERVYKGEVVDKTWEVTTDADLHNF
jgi:hypothetical protein